MTTADEKMEGALQEFRAELEHNHGWVISDDEENMFRDGYQASAAQYSARLKELEQQLSIVGDELTELRKFETGAKTVIGELEQQNEQLQAQVAMLRDELSNCADQLGWSTHSNTLRRVAVALSETTKTAEAHKRRIQAEARAEYRKELLSKMVDRFLSWKLPNNFSPDAGISFTPEYNKEYMASIGKPPMRHEPMGTNLFDADQAKSMVAVMLGGISDEQIDDAVDNLKASFSSELRNQAKQEELKVE